MVHSRYKYKRLTSMYVLKVKMDYIVVQNKIEVKIPRWRTEIDHYLN
jgi:hypothetical protein